MAVQGYWHHVHVKPLAKVVVMAVVLVIVQVVTQHVIQVVKQRLGVVMASVKVLVIRPAQPLVGQIVQGHVAQDVKNPAQANAQEHVRVAVQAVV